MPGEIITTNLNDRFKEVKNYWKEMRQESSIVDMSKSRLNSLIKNAASMKPGIVRQAPQFYHPLFEKINLQLPTKTREINQWARHFYKCFVPGSTVLMADGTLKEIEKVKIGERVITEDGTIGIVNEVFKKKVKTKMIAIKAVGLPETTITRNHPFYMLPKWADQWRWKQTTIEPLQRWELAINIKEGDFLLSPKIKVYNNDFDDVEILTEDEALLLGYYAAEGSLSEGKYREAVRFSFAEKEKDTLIPIVKDICFKKFGKKVNEYSYGRGCIELRINNKEVMKYFKHWCDGRAKTKTLNSRIFYMPDNVKMAFLRAFVDGDGHIERKGNTNPGQIVINLASRNLASQVQQLFVSCGMDSTIFAYNSSCNYKGEKRIYKAWQVRVPPYAAQQLIGRIPEMDDKGRNNVHHWWFKDWMVSRIQKIRTFDYSGYVYNLNVAGNNSFVANGAIVHNTDGIIGNLIDLHSEFPLTSCHITCEDKKIKKFFEILFFDVLRGEKLLLDINLEYWKIGNVFPFGEWNGDKGIWTRFVLLNPDFVEVEKSMLIDEPVLKLDPDDNMKRIVQSRQPRELYNQLAQLQGGRIASLIARGEKIPLNQFRVSHIAYKLSPYETVGTPIMFRAFKPLIYKDILRRAQIAIAERHITPIKVVKVGTDQIPATPEAIQAAKDAFDELNYDLSSWFFYHHAISFDYVSSAGKVLPLDREYDWIDKEITAALLGSKTIIDGSGPNFATASVALRILVNRYLRNQQILKDWVKNYVFKPVAIQQEFKRINEWGDEEYIIPEIEFEFMNLKDDTQMKQLMKELMKTGVLSKQTFFNYIGLNYEKEKKMVQKEYEEDKKEKLPPAAHTKDEGKIPIPELGGGMGGGEGMVGIEAPERPGGAPELPGGPGGGGAEGIPETI